MRYQNISSLCIVVGSILPMSVMAQDAWALAIDHVTSVIPPRALEALELDPLGFFAGVPQDERMNVGVRVRLDADAAGALSNIQWTISGQVIKDYTILSNRATGKGFMTECSTTALSASDLQQSSIEFYYTGTGVSTVTLDALVDNVAMNTSMTFDVRRNPKAEIFYVTGDGATTWTLAQFDDPSFEDKDNVIGEHPRWHAVDPGGEEFFRFHRGYIQKFNCWRGIFGYPCVKVYAHQRIGVDLARSPAVRRLGDDAAQAPLAVDTEVGDEVPRRVGEPRVRTAFVQADRRRVERVGRAHWTDPMSASTP